MSPALSPPLWFEVTLAAWVVTGLYFLVSIFTAQRIASKEAGQKRVLDRLLLWGGYILLFAQFRNPAWNRLYVPLAWAARLGRAGAGLAVAGLALTLWSRIALGRYWSGIVALKQDHKLVRSGPYAGVRHPLYSGLLLASLGTALAFGLWRALAGAALLWIAFLSRARREDTLLAGQFGDEFNDFRAHTGRLLPRCDRSGGIAAALLGGASVALGAICLFSNNFAFTEQPLPARAPRLALAVVTGVVLIAAGAGLFARGASRVAALVLTVNFAFWFVLTLAPTVQAPLVLGNWGGLAEVAMMALGAWLLWRRGGEALPPLWARMAFGVSIGLMGVEHFVYSAVTLTMVPFYLPLGHAAQLGVVYAVGVLHLAAALAIVTGVRVRLASRLWALMLSLFGLLVWVPLALRTPRRDFYWSELLLTLIIAGAGWALARSYAAAAQSASQSA
jgi:protein-S-isoprenylcysteine O-methyltransferase Ste14/uncharacterized membrane protein